MSNMDDIPAKLKGPNTLYRHHTNASREIALVDFLNNGCINPGLLDYGTKHGAIVHDQEDMYRMGKKQELKVGSFKHARLSDH